MFVPFEETTIRAKIASSLLLATPMCMACGSCSFQLNDEHFPCAVVRWFNQIGDTTDPDTGMWTVQPSFTANHAPHFAVIHIDIDAIFHTAHLIPVCGPTADYHSFEITFFIYKTSTLSRLFISILLILFSGLFQSVNLSCPRNK
jgi:hypothetical protein